MAISHRVNPGFDERNIATEHNSMKNLNIFFCSFVDFHINLHLNKVYFYLFLLFLLLAFEGNLISTHDLIIYEAANFKKRLFLASARDPKGN